MLSPKATFMATITGATWAAVASLGCGETADIPTADDLFSPQSGAHLSGPRATIRVDTAQLDGHPACFTTDGAVPGIDRDGECTGKSAKPVSKSIQLECGGANDAATLRQIKLAFDWPERGELHVSATYTLDCSANGSTDEGTPSVPGDAASTGDAWVNAEMARAVTRAIDQIRCDISCTDPTGGGTVGSIDCVGGGSASWRVDVALLEGIAESTFTYDRCDYQTDEGDHLTLDGQLFQTSTFGGDGEERGTLQISGDFEGSYTSNHVFHDNERDGGFVTVACTEHARTDLDGQCAPNNLETEHPFPDYECTGPGCR